MRISLRTVANGAACLVLTGSFAVTVVMTDVLGFLGLFLVGATTWLVCVRAALSNDAPTWSQRAFAARMTAERSPEQRAARHADQEAMLAPLRFLGRCGMVLAAIGAVGFTWQYGWAAGHP